MTILYDNTSTWNVLFRWKGSIIAIDRSLPVSLTLTTIIAIIVTSRQEVNEYLSEYSCMDYLSILANVLTFLMVFRCVGRLGVRVRACLLLTALV